MFSLRKSTTTEFGREANVVDASKAVELRKQAFAFAGMPFPDPFHHF
jgi:hypothetical protein